MNQNAEIMKKRTPISQIMTSNVFTVNQTHSLRDVHNLLKEKGIHHVPVVSGDKVIGMISKTDLERVTFVNNYEGESVSTQMYDALKIEQVMTKQVTTIEKENTVLDAAKILAKNEFHALPVVDGDSIVGIVTTKDMMDYLIKIH